MEKISVTRALAELKMLDKRIHKAIQESKVAAMAIGEEPPKSYKTKTEFDAEALASYQSVKALITRRNKIKSAITLSNALTEVKIGSDTMKVAEAIDRKDAIGYDKLFLAKLKTSLGRINDEIAYEERNVESRLEKRLESDMGSKDRKEFAKEVEEITNNFMKRYKPTMIDPINIRQVIKELEEAIDQFEMEVDFILSESNTQTMIEVTE